MVQVKVSEIKDPARIWCCQHFLDIHEFHLWYHWWFASCNRVWDVGTRVLVSIDDYRRKWCMITKISSFILCSLKCFLWSFLCQFLRFNYGYWWWYAVFDWPFRLGSKSCVWYSKWASTFWNLLIDFLLGYPLRNRFWPDAVKFFLLNLLIREFYVRAHIYTSNKLLNDSVDNKKYTELLWLIQMLKYISVHPYNFGSFFQFPQCPDLYLEIQRILTREPWYHWSGWWSESDKKCHIPLLVYKSTYLECYGK